MTLHPIARTEYVKITAAYIIRVFIINNQMYTYLTCRVEQSVMCPATEASLTADPGFSGLIPARSHTLVEIDHEIISTVILLPSAVSFKKGCCSMCMKYWLTA